MANKSEELRKVITRLLKISCSRTHYEDADDETQHPYQVFSFESKNPDNYPRDDNYFVIDVWDKGKYWTQAESMADEIETNLNMKNEPNETVLPTFYLIDRKNLKDEDKKIKHVQLKFLIKNYYIGA